MAIFSTRKQTHLASWLLDQGTHQSARLMARLPANRPERHGITCTRDVAYGPLPEQRLDIWSPPGAGPFPAVMYIHGGGFRVFSKETHWPMALRLAQQGRLVFSIDYRLAPAHPFPAGLQDALVAWRWLHDQGLADHGGIPDRVVLMGESAGANLSAAVTLAACWDRPEPWAARVPLPRAVVAACGIFQVTETDRYWQRPTLPWVFRDRVRTVPHDYLGLPEPVLHTPGVLELADPVVFLERTTTPPVRPLPPISLPTGTADPLLEDARRMQAALRRWSQAEVRLPEYPGEPHGFMGMLWRRAADRCWTDVAAFLDTVGA